MAHLQPVTRFCTERPGTGDRDLGLPKVLSHCVFAFVVGKKLTS